MKEFSALCLCGLIIGAGVVNAGPVAVAPDPEFDFGKVRQGAKVTHRFVLKNTGDAPLEIIKIRTGCNSCMAVLPDTKSIPAGGSIGITAELRTRGMTGVVRKMFVVETNVPGSELVPFALKGEVRPFFNLTPAPYFFLRGLKPGKAASWEFDLTLVDLPDCALLGTTSPEGFEIDTVLNEKVATHHLTVRYNGGELPVGLLRSTTSLTTDSTALPTIEIPIMARVPGAVQAFPPVLLLAFPAATGQSTVFRPVRKSLQVRSTSLTPFSILEVVSPNPALQTTYSGTPSVRQSITITLTAPLPQGKVGDLIITTNAPGGRELRIPVHIAPAPDGRTTAPSAQPPTHAFSADKALPAVAGALGKSLNELIAGIGKGGEGDLAVWAASQLCRRSPTAAELRKKLGGIGLVRYARARDMIALHMARDAAFAARCRQIVEQARLLVGEDSAPE